MKPPVQTLALRNSHASRIGGGFSSNLRKFLPKEFPRDAVLERFRQY